MRTKILICIAGCAALFAGCEGEKLLPPSNDLVVVRAYLQAEAPLRDLHISSTLDLGSPDTLGPPVEDATVHIIRNEVCYELLHFGNGDYGQPSNPYTTDCPDCGLDMLPGDTIFLEIFHFGKVATAHTVIPPEPRNLLLSEYPVVVPSTVEANPVGDAVEISWDADEGDYWYYLEISCHSSTKIPIGGGDPVYGYVPKVITEPSREKSYVLTWDQMPYYGNYRIYVVAVTREYMELYLTRNQDSRDLNEPASNVSNGLGIFTSVNKGLIDFAVVPADQ